MKQPRFILLLLFFFLGLFLRELKAEIIILENDKIESFSEQSFQEQTQETKWLGLPYLQEESHSQNQYVSFNFSTESLPQNFLGKLCLKNASENLESSFQFFQTTLSHQLELEEVNRFFTDDAELVEAWKALGEFPTLRKNIPNLETLEKVKGRFTYNGKTGQAALEEIFTGHKSAQKFIDNFKKYDEIIGEVDDITVTGIKSSAEVRILNKGSQVGKVIDGKLNVNYSGFGGDIVCDPNKTTTLIGKWTGGTEDIWNTGLAKQVNNASGTKGGMNILGEVDMAPSPSVVWEGQNKPWLDAAISRGDVVKAVSDPIDINHVFFNKNNIPNSVFSSPETLTTYLKNLSDNAPEVSQLGFYGREIRHLFQNGYTYNSALKVFSK